jgi:uncharacterized protein DUF927
MTKAKKTKPTSKPLIVQHDGETINVDEALLDIAIESALMTLPEMMAHLKEGNKEHALMLGDELKGELVRLPDTKRASAISAMNVWIEANGNGQANTLRNIVGLPNESKREPLDLIRESTIMSALEAAAQADTLSKRDDLIGAAVRHLARLKNPLAIERWKKPFARAGVTGKTLAKMLKEVEAEDDGDPVRALIQDAAESPDQEAALRVLFTRLATFSPFELVKYRQEVQDRIGLQGSLFDGMLTQARKLGSRAEIVDGMLHYQRELLCNFSARITHQLTMDDGQNMPKVKYTLEAKMADGRVMPTIEIDAEEFEEIRKWVPRHYGADAISFVPPAQMYRISTAIKEISRNDGMKRETVHTHTGWATVAGKRAFLTAGGAISADGLDPDVRVDLGHNRLALYRLPDPPKGEVLQQAIKQSLAFLQLAPLHVTAPLWSMMYGAPLMPVFSLNAVPWIYGPTQSGKSTLTMLALTHFGPEFIKGRDYQAPKDWLSTVTDLEGAMFATKDLPLVIDDFAPQFTGMGDARDIHKRAHQVVRSVGNRSSRGRANADLTERAQRPPRGLVIGTAELPLEGQSIVGRMIYVPVEKADVFPEGNRLDEAQKIAGPGSGLYALAMAGYVQWLATKWDDVIDDARKYHERANTYARTVFPSSQSRMMDYYAHLMTYARTALRWMVEVGALTTVAAQEMANVELPAALASVLSNQTKRVANQSPVVKLFEAIADLLLSRRAYLEKRTGTTESPPHDAVLIGWWEANVSNAGGKPVVYLRMNTCLQLARDYWMRAGGDLNSTKDALQREIFQAGLLAWRANNELAVSQWITSQNRTVKVLAIDATRLEDVAGVDIWPGEREESDDATP